MPPLPFAVVISAHDDCTWDEARHELIDTIRLRLFGIPVGQMVMRLRAAPTAS